MNNNDKRILAKNINHIDKVINDLEKKGKTTNDLPRASQSNIRFSSLENSMLSTEKAIMGVNKSVLVRTAIVFIWNNGIGREMLKQAIKEEMNHGHKADALYDVFAQLVTALNGIQSELNRQGNNLNQISRKLNSHEYVPNPQAEKAFLEAFTSYGSYYSLINNSRQRFDEAIAQAERRCD